MQIPLERVMWLCCSVAVMACGTGHGEGTTLATSSWDVELQVTISENPQQVPVSCPSVAFTMNVDPLGAELAVVLGSDGLVSGGGRLLRKDPDTYQLAAPMTVPTNGNCFADSLEMTNLSLRATDVNGDGVPDGLSGTGMGSGTKLIGDVRHSFSIVFEMTGRPDVTPPSLIAPGGALHPLDGVALAATEPLVATAQLRLEGTTSIDLAVQSPIDGATGAVTANVIVPFSGTWVLTGDATDLIGLPLDRSLTVASLTDPGFFVADGFEGATLHAAVTQGVRVVSAFADVLALSGDRSLLVEVGASATLHLARPPGASAVRFKSRMLVRNAGGYHGYGLVRVGVVGGVVRSEPSLGSAEPGVTETGDLALPFVTPLVEVTVPLAEDGGDVVLQISPLPRPGCASWGGLCPAVPAVLIDDVRVE